MRWFTYNWQLKLLALGLSVFLWLVLHYKAPVRTPLPPMAWPASK